MIIISDKKRDEGFKWEKWMEAPIISLYMDFSVTQITCSLISAFQAPAGHYW